MSTCLRLVLLLLLAGAPAAAPAQTPARAEASHAAPPAFGELVAYAEMARLAYQPDSAVVARYAPRFRVRTRDLPGLGGRYLLLTSNRDSTHYVAIRGTSNLKNVLEDLEYHKRPDAKVGVHLHEGFEHSTYAVYRDLLLLLQPGYRVHLTGHSLGGAMAVILMMHLHADGIPVEKVVTFGQPKVTNAAGMRAYRHFPVVRVVDCRDPVPLVPPLTITSALHGPYRHFGPEIILMDDAHYVYLPEHAAERFSVTSFWAHLGEHDVGDHRMDRYLERVRNKQERATPIRYEDIHRHPCTPASTTR